MTLFSIEPRTREYVKGYGFLSLVRNSPNKYRSQWFYAGTKTGLDVLTVTKKEAHKTAEAIGKILLNKTANKILKPNSVLDKNSRNVEEINIPPEQRAEILNQLRQT